MSNRHHGVFLPADLHQDLLEFLGEQPLRLTRVVRMHAALQGLPHGHIPAPNSAPAPLPTLVGGETDDGQDPPIPSFDQNRP